MLVAKLIHAVRYCDSYIGGTCNLTVLLLLSTSKPPNNSSLLMASVYDIKLFVRDNGRRNAHQ